MVKTVAARVNNELYDEAIEKVNNIGLKSGSELVRYAFAIVCGYSVKDARAIALIKPELPFSALKDGE